MQQRHSHTSQPNKECAGSRHIKVSPCPVLLTEDTKSGIVVAVDGRHVAGSKIGRQSECFNRQNCYNAERVVGSRTQWLFTSGRSCGDALIVLHAKNQRGRTFGIYYLAVSNEYCP